VLPSTIFSATNFMEDMSSIFPICLAPSGFKTFSENRVFDTKGSQGCMNSKYRDTNSRLVEMSPTRLDKVATRSEPASCICVPERWNRTESKKYTEGKSLRNLVENSILESEIGALSEGTVSE
jgi:hypothetical protein